jgi:hypothetical protein
MDPQVCKILTDLSLPYLTPIPIEDFEKSDPELLESKQNRTLLEYYFTCTPSWPLYILRHNANIDLVTYLDADLFFFSDPAPIYYEMDKGSILIVEHRFPPRLQHMKLYGTYNVGFLSFRRDEKGLECLEWWREQCIEWCYDRVEGGRFADQKYLDDWPSRFSGVVILQHKGAGLAPWNLDNYSLGYHKGKLLVDSTPLIFYHFHGFKRINAWFYDPGSTAYALRGNSLVKRHLYGPYWRTLQSIEERLNHHSHGPEGLHSKGFIDRPKRYGTPESLDAHYRWNGMRRFLTFLKNIVIGRYWLFLGGRIL